MKMKTKFGLMVITMLSYSGAIAQDIIPDSQIEIIAVSPVMEDECSVDEMDGKCTKVIHLDYCLDSYASRICFFEVNGEEIGIVFY